MFSAENIAPYQSVSAPEDECADFQGMEVLVENLGRTLMAKPEGLLHLFIEAGVSVELLAGAFETDARTVESSLREAMRKRDAAARALPSGVVDSLDSVFPELHGKVDTLKG